MVAIISDAGAVTQRLLKCAAGPIVVIPVFDAFEEVVQCYESIRRHTTPDVAVLVMDDASRDDRLFAFYNRETEREHGSRTLIFHRNSVNQGFVRNVNLAFSMTAPHDVVLVNSDVLVGPEWLERLQSAATCSSTVASVSTLASSGTILSVPHRNIPARENPRGLTTDQAASLVAAGSVQLRPRIPTAVGHCLYIRRAALNLVGFFDEAFSPGYSEEVDWSQRAIARGFEHVCADDVYVQHKTGRSFGRSETTRRLITDHDLMIDKRYPYYFEWITRAQNDPHSPLATAIAVAKQALVGLSLVIDGTCLGPTTMGTQIVVVETVRALSRRDEFRDITVVVPDSIPRQKKNELAAMGVRVAGTTAGPSGRADIVYRPFQVNYAHELDWLRTLGDRVVVHQLDLIAFDNPTYAADGRDWCAYRDLARAVGAVVDGVAFLSNFSKTQATREGLVAPSKPTAVIYAGVDHHNVAVEARRPQWTSDLDPGFVLCIGTNYRHKNRPFAIESWMEMRRRGFGGQLVLAGPTPPYGNSLPEEAALRLNYPELLRDLVILGELRDEEKRWLYEHAALVLYPTVSEGFGLVPFEAAHFGVPCLSTRQGALDEILPKGLPSIREWDAAATACIAMQLISESDSKKALTDALLETAAEFTWDRVAERLIELFDHVVRTVPTRTASVHGEAQTQVGRYRPSLVASSAHRMFAWSVHKIVEHPRIHRTLSPRGSRREKTARTIIRSAERRIG